MLRTKVGFAAAALLVGVATGGEEPRPRPAGATVTGRVLSEPGGRAVAGAVVTLWNGSGAGQWTARTDEKGAYSFPDVQPGDYYKVWIEERPGKEAGVWSEAVVVRVADAPVRADDLFAGLPQSLSGTVTDADTGKPVGGAVVNFSTADRNRQSVKTDADGRYRLFVPPREVDLYCAGTPDRYEESGQRHQVAVGDGKQVEAIDFKVKSAPPFTGLVVLPDGKPAGGAEVWVEAHWPPSPRGGFSFSGRTVRFTTDEAGRFVGYMRGASGAETVDLKAMARTPDHRAGGVARGATTARDGYRIDPLKVVLARSAGVLVRVVDPDGKPLHNSVVMASSSPWRDWFGLGGPVKHVGDGKYLIMGLIPGLEYHVWANTPGFRSAVSAETITLKPDETRELADFRLEWWGKKAVPGLVKQLQGPDGRDREYAASLLGSLGADAAEAVPALVAVLKNDPANTVRYGAAAALGRIGPWAKAAAPDLVKALEEDAGGGVRREAATALGLIGEPSAVPALEKALTHPDTDVRRAAAEAMKRLDEAAKRRPLAP